MNSAELSTAYAGDQSSLRYERKFLAAKHDARQLEAILKMHPCNFRVAFPERRVNSLYCDTENLDCYWDHEAGAANRIKTRVRWYGKARGLISDPFLELKIKRSDLNRKLRFPLPPFEIGGGFACDSLSRALKLSQLPPIVATEMAGKRAALLVQYDRKYYLSGNGKYRVTIDSNISWIVPSRKGEGAAPTACKQAVIVELKYSHHDDNEADRIANAFPFPICKNSKYMLGVRAIILETDYLN